MKKLNIRVGNIAFGVFLLVFPFGIIGDVSNMFGYPVLSYLHYLRGGGYVLGALFCIFYLPQLSTAVIKNAQNPMFDFLIFIVSPLLVITVVLIQLFHHIDVVGPVANGVNKSAFEFNWPITVAYFSMFFIGFYLFDIVKEQHNTILILWLLSIVLVLINVNYVNLTFDFMGTIDPSDRAFTLVLSDSLAILSLCLFPTLVTKFRVLSVLMLSLLCLFFISSRTALLVMILTYIIYSLRDIVSFKTLFVFFLAFLLLYFSWGYLQENASGYSTRLFSLSNNDDSVTGRMSMLNAGERAIRDNFFVGDFAGQLVESYDSSGARWGGYIHGILSYFRQFGIIAFGAVSVIFFNAFWVLFNVPSYNYSARLFTMLPIYIITVMFFSRGYVYPWFFLIPGLMFSLQNENKSR